MKIERKHRDCIKSRRDKIGITGHIMMHQVISHSTVVTACKKLDENITGGTKYRIFTDSSSSSSSPSSSSSSSSSS